MDADAWQAQVPCFSWDNTFADLFVEPHPLHPGQDMSSLMLLRQPELQFLSSTRPKMDRLLVQQIVASSKVHALQLHVGFWSAVEVKTPIQARETCL